MSSRLNYFFALLLFVALVLASTLYTVREGQKGILEFLGKIVVDEQQQPIVSDPGLHWKWPFVNRVRIFDTRLQTLNEEVGRRSSSQMGGNARIVTQEKKDVIVDYYVKWRITNLAKFLTSTQGDYLYAENLLKKIVSDSIRAEFGKRTITDVVSGERTDIMKILRGKAKSPAAELGVIVNDVRIKKIDLPQAVSKSVYQRMRTEREKKANEHRGQGRSKASVIRAEADRRVIEITAQAESDAKRIQGEGDGIAAKIYGDVYKLDPEFYEFYRSLEAYRHTFNKKDDLLVLRPEDNDFFKHFSLKNAKSAR